MSVASLVPVEAVTPLLAGLADEAGEFQADEHWQSHLQRLESLQNFQPQVPSTLQAELRDYQREGFAWLACGGVLYTIGIIFFAYDSRFRHWHGIWHLFVMAGSLLHFVAIWRYVL